MSSLSAEQLSSGLRELNRVFGSKLDKEVLESVLEICGGDARQAVAFLQAQTGDYVDPGPSAGGQASLPTDYMSKPDKFSVLQSSAAAESAAEKVKKLFLSDSSFADHVNWLENDRPHYIAVLLMLIEKGVELGAATKGRVLAATWNDHNWALANYLLAHEEQFGLIDVLRACRILDAPRKVRALERKLARLEKQGTAKPKTVGVVRAKLNDVKADVPGAETQKTSVTGALARKIRQWVASIPPEKLDFFALQLPKEPWKELSDIVHFHPNDFSLPWFLPVCFGASPPNESMTVQAALLTAENALEVVSKSHLPYSFLRKQLPDITAEVKAEVAKYEKLDTLIWYYEELQCAEVDSTISSRLSNGEEPLFSYGKLMERLLFFKMCGAPFYDKLIPVAEKRLGKIRLPLEPPVVVLGDASYSMDVAIRTATIIGSLLSALTNADLRFFNVQSFAPPINPRTIQEVLECATRTKADGLTAPACTIWEYYEKKEIVKFFVVVSDEIENEKNKGEFFGQLFYKYCRDVYPAKIVFVSFLENPLEKGRMVKSLENLGIVPLQFRLDSHRPDLTKVDTLLGLLSSECSFFSIQVDALASVIAEHEDRGKAFEAALAKMEDLPVPDEIVKPEKTEKEEEKEVLGKGKEKDKKATEEEIPEDFLCPITTTVMEDPVVAADGMTYERTAIEEWLGRKKTSPLTGQELESVVLYPNFNLRSRIKEWQSKHQEK